MKKFITLAMLSLTLSAVAGLDPDLKCTGETKEGEKIEVIISDLDFVKEVSIKKGTNSCGFQIIGAKLSERGVAPSLTFDFEREKSCDLTKTIKLQKDGFVKLVLNPAPEIYVLALIGHHPIPCRAKALNLKKLKDRAVNLF